MDRYRKISTRFALMTGIALVAGISLTLNQCERSSNPTSLPQSVHYEGTVGDEERISSAAVYLMELHQDGHLENVLLHPVYSDTLGRFQLDISDTKTGWYAVVARKAERYWKRIIPAGDIKDPGEICINPLGVESTVEADVLLRILQTEANTYIPYDQVRNYIDNELAKTLQGDAIAIARTAERILAQKENVKKRGVSVSTHNGVSLVTVYQRFLVNSNNTASLIDAIRKKYWLGSGQLDSLKVFSTKQGNNGNDLTQTVDTPLRIQIVPLGSAYEVIVRQEFTTDLTDLNLLKYEIRKRTRLNSSQIQRALIFEDDEGSRGEGRYHIRVAVDGNVALNSRARDLLDTLVLKLADNSPFFELRLNIIKTDTDITVTNHTKGNLSSTEEQLWEQFTRLVQSAMSDNDPGQRLEISLANQTAPAYRTFAEVNL